MFPGFDRIIEERIRTAQARGEFDNLQGAGRPLNLAEDSHIPADLRMAHRILKNAGCLPPEIDLKKEIDRTEDLLAGMPETEEKYRLLKKLNCMILKLNIMGGRRAGFDVPQRYMGKVVDRIGKKQ